MFDSFFAEGGRKAISFVYQEAEVPGIGKQNIEYRNSGLLQSIYNALLCFYVTVIMLELIIG